MYKDKKIFILGMARSGYEAAKFLSKHNNKITITDMKEQNEEHVKELTELGVNYIISSEPDKLLDESYDVVIKNPGIRRDHSCVLRARALNIPVINEVEAAYSFLKDKVKIVAITGSNGKTTTTTMIHNILESAGIVAHLGGNIGYPVCSLVDIASPGDTLILEISDHQLVDMYKFKADIAVLTNLYEVHLDFHESYAVYKNMKKKIFNDQDETNLAILNYDNEDVMSLTSDLKSNKYYFSKNEDTICKIKNNAIYYKDELVVELKDILLKGNHNYENIMCAIIVAREFGVSNEIIRKYLNEFGGVEHRIEFVTSVSDVNYYNDSKATNVDSTIIALDSFNTPTILLLGGLDRGHSFEPLEKHLVNVKTIVCFGETKERIKEFAESLDINCIVVDNIKDAVEVAHGNATCGDTVLLSPACASWDQFKTFEERGETFKKEVLKYMV